MATAISICALIVGATLLAKCVQRARRRSIAQAESRAFDDLLLRTLHKGLTQAEASSILRGLRQKDPRRAQLVLDLKVLRESIDVALSSRDGRAAASRMTMAEGRVRDITQYRAELTSAHVIDQVMQTLCDTQKKFRTATYINVSRGHAETARLSTCVDTKSKHLELAREVIRQGIAVGEGDLIELTAELQSVDEALSKLA